MLGAIIGGIASIASTVAGLWSGNKARKQRDKEYNAQLALEERNFQEQKRLNEHTMFMDQQQMANEKLRMEREDNAFQRQVADLQAAGLNKNIALGGGGAASGAGGQAGGTRMSGDVGIPQTPPQVSMMEQAMMGAQIASTFAQNKLTEAEVDRTKAETQEIGERIDNNKNLLELGRDELKEKIRNNEVTETQLKQSVETEMKNAETRAQELQFDKQKYANDSLLRTTEERLQELKIDLLEIERETNFSKANVQKHDEGIITHSLNTSNSISQKGLMAIVNRIELWMSDYNFKPKGGK